MTSTGMLDCHDTTRRGDVRAASSNGIDYVEVSDDQLTLRVFFLGKAPAEIDVRNVRIDGGQRVRDIHVREVNVHREPRRGRDDWMDVVVDRPGDFSTYTLRVVDAGHQDHQMHGFDRRYASLDFSFKASCPSDLDCADEPSCAPTVTASPDINYLARDYTGFRQLLLDRLSVIMPEWRERHVPDIGIALVEVLAYTGDYLSQYQDAVATEAYLETARLRISVRRHARLVDYRLFEGSNARAWLTIDTRTDFALDLGHVSFVTRYSGAPVGTSQLLWSELDRLPSSAYEIFEPLWPARPTLAPMYAAHSRIRFYTWGDGECCLPAGATDAWLVDGWHPAAPAPIDRTHRNTHDASPRAATRARQLDALKVGDVLILEEVIGPHTGNPTDADPRHRHAVRIVELKREVDTLYPTDDSPTHDSPTRGTPVVYARWCVDDALPFALCISTHKPAPDCGPLSDVSVASGNVILVDHGRSVSEWLPPVPGKDPAPVCDPCDDVAETPAPPRFEPVLTQAPLTFAAPLDPTACPSRVMSSTGRVSLPQASLEAEAGDHPTRWWPRQDLLDVSPTDRAFVAEMDDDGFAHLRFAADPALRPARGTSLHAHYRVGLGPDGNVGPESIAFVVSDDVIAGGVEFTMRNPMPAAGGQSPESVAEARLLAPSAFRSIRERAVIASDYAELLERDLGADVQGAASALRWNGSWYEAQVGVDARGSEEASKKLLQHARAVVHRYRRIGHDVQVSTARHVPLAIALDVCIASHEMRSSVRTALLSALGSGRQRDGRLGLFHPDNLRYGEGVSVSALVAAAARIAGVASLAVTQLERMAEGPNSEIENGILPIGAMEIAQLDNDPSFPERGTLVITMRGGR